MTVYEPDYCPYCGDAVATDADGVGYCDDCDRYVGKVPVPAVECTVVDGDRALVVERAAGREQGTWGLPGGHLASEDDTPAAAAERELAEETGLQVDPADLVLLDALLEDNDDGSSYLTVGFAVDVGDVVGEARSADRETTAVRYVDPESFAEPTFRPSDPSRLAAAIDLFR